MKTRICLALCLFCVSVSPLHAQQSSVEGLVLANEKKFSELQIQRKCDEAARLLDREFRGISTGIGTNSEFLSACKSDENIPTREKFSDVNFTLLSPETALITYEDLASFLTGGGRPTVLKGNVASVWVKPGSEWLLSLHTATSIPFAVTDQGKVRLLYPDSDEKRDESVHQNKVGEATIDISLPDSLFIDKEKEVWEALKKKDKAADSRLLADDFVGLYATGFATKSDHVKQMDDRYSIESYDVQDTKVLRLSPKMALLLYKAICKGSGEWEQFCSRPDYVSSLWVERDGRWVDLFSQDTTATNGESDDAVLKAIVANEKKIMETLQRNDLTAFGNMLPDDLIDVEDGGIHTKAEWLKEFEEQKRGGLLFKDFKMEDLRLIRYGTFAATLVFRETIDGMQNGKPFEWHTNSSSGYVNRDGNWVPILYQDTMSK